MKNLGDRKVAFVN